MTIQDENKIACDWLLNYYDKIETYQDMVNKFKTLGAMEYSGMPGSSTTGNPTLNKAVTLTEIEKYKDWLMVIEKVESMLNDKSREFLRLWRLAVLNPSFTGGRHGWYNEVSNQYAKFFERKYGKYFLPSNGTLKQWRIKLIEVTARLAIRKGLI